MSNYAKSDVPDDISPRFYADYEIVNGTGSTLLWVHDGTCEQAGGTVECCTGTAQGCQYVTMPWQDMDQIGVYLMETAARARMRQLREDSSSC